MGEGISRLKIIISQWLTRCQSMRSIQRASGDRIFHHENSRFADVQLNFWRQVSVLTHRDTVRLFRDQVSLCADILHALFVLLVVGLIYFKLDLTQSGIQNFTGSFFFLVTSLTFSAANQTFFSILLELPIMSRESAAELYHLFAWYLSKNISEVTISIVLRSFSLRRCTCLWALVTDSEYT